MESRLYRPAGNRVIAGVCSGIAEFFALDPTIVRLAWAVLAIVGGTGFMLYLAAWAVIPEEDGRRATLPMVLLVLLFGFPVLCAVVAACIGVFASMFGR